MSLNYEKIQKDCLSNFSKTAETFTKIFSGVNVNSIKYLEKLNNVNKLNFDKLSSLEKLEQLPDIAQDYQKSLVETSTDYVVENTKLAVEANETIVSPYFTK